MTGSIPPPPERTIADLSKDVAKLKRELDDLERARAALDVEYRRAKHGLAAKVEEDVAFIRDARREVEQITSILHGTELFGRYAEDADHHLRIANRWRYGAVATLLLAPCVAGALALADKLKVATGISVMSCLIGLFLYASIESHNHRRREFDRRRIALRVSAIESFTKQRREGGDPAARKTAEDLLDEFVRMHFIFPELDSNDITQLTPRTGPFGAKERSSQSRSQSPPAVPAIRRRRNRPAAPE
ncbi:hypothetical protein ACFCV3_11575 [Kribbella sp. NPDC056345]|uniref:hypothetical protein n=1 Tax=Kribbella sp. NPDC056345 TaxID=3345789 RepID=UPI0035E0A2B5